jgi:hypothetical protein
VAALGVQSVSVPGGVGPGDRSRPRAVSRAASRTSELSDTDPAPRGALRFRLESNQAAILRRDSGKSVTGSLGILACAGMELHHRCRRRRLYRPLHCYSATDAWGGRPESNRDLAGSQPAVRTSTPRPPCPVMDSNHYFRFIGATRCHYANRACYLSTPGRSRTCTDEFVVRHDLRFTTGA